MPLSSSEPVFYGPDSRYYVGKGNNTEVWAENGIA